MSIKTEQQFYRRLSNDAQAEAGDRDDMMVMLTARFRRCLPEAMIESFRLFRVEAVDRYIPEVYVIGFRLCNRMVEWSRAAEDLLWPEVWREIEFWVHDLYHMYYLAADCSLCVSSKSERNAENAEVRAK